MMASMKHGLLQSHMIRLDLFGGMQADTYTIG